MSADNSRQEVAKLKDRSDRRNGDDEDEVAMDGEGMMALTEGWMAMNGRE